MASRVNIVGAAAGLHVLALSLLNLVEAEKHVATRAPVELVVVAAPPAPPPPAAEATPPPPRPPAPEPVRPRPRIRRVASVATPRPAAAAAAASAPEPAAAPASASVAEPPAPAPAEGSDEAVLLATIGRAGRNGPPRDEGQLGNDTAEGFFRGAARGLTTPPHESRAAPAEPAEDYTRLIPRYTDQAIDHDVSASVAVRVELDEHGRVTSASILKGAGYGLDEVAIAMIKEYKFKPALDDEGRPVRSTFGWRIVWESHWRRLLLYDAYGHPPCRGQGPLNLGSAHPVYIDCDGPAGYFELDEAQ